MLALSLALVLILGSFVFAVFHGVDLRLSWRHHGEHSRQVLVAAFDSDSLDQGQGEEHHREEQAPEAGRTIYAVGDDHHVYKQTLRRMSPTSAWTLAANGSFASLAVDGSRIYAVGLDGRVYTQSVLNMSTASEWAAASAKGVTWIAIAGGEADAIYAVGTDHAIYSQTLSKMRTSTRWEGPFCQGTDISSIAIAGDLLFGVGVDGSVYIQAMSGLRTSRAWDGPISHSTNISSFVSAGSSIYGVAHNGKVYRQVSSSTWDLAGRGRVRALAVGEPPALWLQSSPAWSRSGREAVGAWVSSIADDEWGKPDEEGPANLLGGGVWRARWRQVRDQWFVVDLGKPMLVSALRLRGQQGEPKKSPRNLRWQFGPGLDGPWTDAALFQGDPDGGWAEAGLTPPTTSRWWRLYVDDTFGDGGPEEDMCIITGFRIQAALVEKEETGDEAEAEEGARSCPSRFVVPPRPIKATDLNGVALPDVCFNSTEGPHHVFIIGDWGGLVYEEGAPPRPADHRSPLFPTHRRKFVTGVDDCAQLRVAAQMRNRARLSRPDYVLNVGDNFYWGGVKASCGARLGIQRTRTGQWGAIFEDIYHGPGLDWVQWLGVLGNHDYGGFMFTNGWDQTIGYTWAEDESSTRRWVTPAQYWKSKVWYPGFSVDYYFLDSNVYDAFEPGDFVGHNLCSVQHNPENATCAPQGPKSVWDCPRWFQNLWASQEAWIHNEMANSTADWQIIITHFPPDWGKEFWVPLVRKFGVDLVISGHTHRQELHGAGEDGNFLGDTAYIISGGGGGITSQEEPHITGEDDQYGFMDMSLAAESLSIDAISHGGQVRKSVVLHPRYPDPPLATSKAQARRRRGTGQSHSRRDPKDRKEEEDIDEGKGGGSKPRRPQPADVDDRKAGEEKSEPRRPRRAEVDELEAAEERSEAHRPGLRHTGHAGAQQESQLAARAGRSGSGEQEKRLDARGEHRDVDASLVSHVDVAPLEAVIERSRRRAEVDSANSSDGRSGLDSAVRAKASHDNRSSAQHLERNADSTTVVLQ